MRLTIGVSLVLFSLGILACAVVAHRSNKRLARDVFILLVALLPPMQGNLLIMMSGDWTMARIGCYLYYIGLNVTVLHLLLFTVDYCRVAYRGTLADKVVRVLLLVDAAQLLLNIFTGHAFTTTAILVDGYPYHALVPLAGQTFHRLVAYGVFFASLAIFAWRLATSSRIYAERYGVLLAAIVVTGIWESYYIFSRTPVDRAMLGYGAFGLCVFYFALYYRPTHLLDRLLSRAVSEMREAVLFFDRDRSCIYVNDAAEKLLGFEDAADLTHCEERVAELLGTRRLDMGSGDWSHDVIVGEGADWRSFRAEYRNVSDAQGRSVGSMLSIEDHTEEERRRARELYLSRHDELTGLFSKEHLYQRIRQQMDAHPEVVWSVVAMDVRDFKLINDMFGKEVGDAVLCDIASYLRGHVVPGEVYGRITGDRFGLLLPGDLVDLTALEGDLARRRVISDRDGALRMVSVGGEGDAPFEGSYSVTLHAGVYEVSEPDLAVSVMFDRAFMAIESIKDDLERHVAVYDESMRDDTLWSRKISDELDHAIEDGQVRPYLQPMVDNTGKIVGAEVLVRWIHPEEGFLSPGRFVPVFERNGRIVKMDAFMWESACQILAEWQERGVDLFLSVNISPKDFYLIDVQATICELVRRYGIEPRRLRLEITETVMMSDIERRLQIIKELQADGFLVEMDDFGSGYSSLNLLKDIPVDVLKIDMMFLNETRDGQRARKILQSIVDLSGKLEIPSVAEGVETIEQRDMLVDMGCQLFQGYYFARPMPRADFEELYRQAA